MWQVRPTLAKWVRSEGLNEAGCTATRVRPACVCVSVCVSTGRGVCRAAWHHAGLQNGGCGTSWDNAPCTASLCPLLSPGGGDGSGGGRCLKSSLLGTGHCSSCSAPGLQEGMLLPSFLPSFLVGKFGIPWVPHPPPLAISPLLPFPGDLPYCFPPALGWDAVIWMPSSSAQLHHCIISRALVKMLLIRLSCWLPAHGLQGSRQSSGGGCC